MINVGDATESFTLAYEHQDANKPKINKRDFWQNPRKVRKKRRRDAHRTLACSEKGRKNSFLATRKKKESEDRRYNMLLKSKESQTTANTQKR